MFKNKVRLITIIISILCLTVMITAIATGAETITGKCGESTEWSFDDVTHTLTVKGSGEIDEELQMPWSEFGLSVDTLVVEDGVTVIPDAAFFDCTALKSVTLPASVKTIAKNAFHSTKLTGINCPCDSYAAQFAMDNSYDAILSHVFGEWEEKITPTTKHDGVEARVCSRCSVEEVNTLPMLTNIFTDIPNVSWYTESALWCNHMGYMSGTSNGIFSPNMPLTRAQFVQILAKIDGAPLKGMKYRAIFTDVPNDQWFTNAVMWAYDNGVTSGIGGGLFGADQRVTRQELAVFLRAYAQKHGKDVSAAYDITGYTDYELVSPWATQALFWALGEGIMKGTTYKTVSPTITATRAQVSVIMKLFCEKALTDEG